MRVGLGLQSAVRNSTTYLQRGTIRYSLTPLTFPASDMAERVIPARVWQFTLLAALVFAAPLGAQQQAGGTYDIEGLFLQGYMFMLDAEKLEGQKNFTGSYYKYQEARDVFDSVARAQPGWQTNMVNFRRNFIRKKMEEVRQRERDRRAASGTGTSGPNLDLLPPLDNPPAPGSPSVPAPPQTLPDIPANPRAPIDDRLGEMQRQIGRYSAENQRLQDTMTAREGELFKVKQELLANKQELNAALEKQIELQNKVDTADQKRDRELGELKKRLEETTTALARATKIQDEATTRIDGLMSELSQARESDRAPEQGKGSAGRGAQPDAGADPEQGGQQGDGGPARREPAPEGPP